MQYHLLKGTTAYHWPYDSELYCLSCGESEYRQFLSAAADEEVYQGIGNPFACESSKYQLSSLAMPGFFLMSELFFLFFRNFT